MSSWSGSVARRARHAGPRRGRQGAVKLQHLFEETLRIKRSTPHSAVLSCRFRSSHVFLSAIWWSITVFFRIKITEIKTLDSKMFYSICKFRKEISQAWINLRIPVFAPFYRARRLTFLREKCRKLDVDTDVDDVDININTLLRRQIRLSPIKDSHYPHKRCRYTHLLNSLPSPSPARGFLQAPCHKASPVLSAKP